jgi:excisionase family DNA binding protein
MTNHEKTEWWSVADVQRHFGVSVSTIYRWMKAGVLPSHRVANGRRFKRHEVESIDPETLPSFRPDGTVKTA